MPPKKNYLEAVASKAVNAAAEGKFVKLGESGPTGFLKGSGIARQLSKAKTAGYVYVIDPRFPVAGSMDLVARYLQATGQSLQSVQHISAANVASYAGPGGVLDQLAARSKAYPTAKSVRAYTVTLSDLVQAALLMSKDKNAVKITWPPEQKGKKAKSGSKAATPKKARASSGAKSRSGGVRPKATLAQRVQAATQKGQVLNVSGKNPVAVTITPASRVVVLHGSGLAAMPDARAAMQQALNEIGQGGRIGEWDMAVNQKKMQKTTALPPALPLASVSPRRSAGMSGLPLSPSRRRTGGLPVLGGVPSLPALAPL